jgi:hypothetical protein
MVQTDSKIFFFFFSIMIMSSIALVDDFQILRLQSLRKCTSLTSDLSNSASLDEQSKSNQHAYTPAHSPPCRIKPVGSVVVVVVSLAPRLQFGDDNNNDSTDQLVVYTRLQTQLYPTLFQSTRHFEKN